MNGIPVQTAVRLIKSDGVRATKVNGTHCRERATDDVAEMRRDNSDNEIHARRGDESKPRNSGTKI